MKKDKIKILRLSTEDIDLLISLSQRFNISQSEVIRRAIKVFAAQWKHIYTVLYQPAVETKDDGTTEININTEPDLSWDELINGIQENRLNKD